MSKHDAIPYRRRTKAEALAAGDRRDCFKFRELGCELLDAGLEKRRCGECGFYMPVMEFAEMTGRAPERIDRRARRWAPLAQGGEQ